MDLQKGFGEGTYNLGVTAGENRVVIAALSRWGSEPEVDVTDHANTVLLRMVALSSGDTTQVYNGLDDDTLGGLVNALTSYSSGISRLMVLVLPILEGCGMPPIANSDSNLGVLFRHEKTANELAFEIATKHEAFMEPIPNQLPSDFA